MGEVHVGVHQRTGARHAIKSLPSTTDAELLLRFQREAEALARLDGHPHVVRVHAAGDALGRRYLVMDLASGGDLKARIEAHGPLSPAAAVDLGLALASGLAHVHRRGLLHRDLKPHNVLFDAPEQGGRPRLVDFGLVRDADARSLTASGQIVGTPAYMAPEQARGDRAAQGPPTDVYGLAALLFHALTGRPPFTGGSPLMTLARVLKDPPPSARALAPDVPPALDAALLKALAKSPADRFPSAEAFAAALEATGGAPVARRRGLVVGLVSLGVAGAFAAVAVPGAPGALREVSPEITSPGRSGGGTAPGGEGPPQGAPAAATTAAAPTERAPVDPLAGLEPPRPDPPQGVSPDVGRLWENVRAAGPPLDPANALVIARQLREARSEVAELEAARWYGAAAREALARSERSHEPAFRSTFGSIAGEAFTGLARAFGAGRGVPLDLERAAACLGRASDLGHVPGRLALAEALIEGYYGLQPDPDRAFALLKEDWERRSFLAGDGLDVALLAARLPRMKGVEELLEAARQVAPGASRALRLRVAILRHEPEEARRREAQSIVLASPRLQGQGPDAWAALLEALSILHELGGLDRARALEQLRALPLPGARLLRVRLGDSDRQALLELANGDPDAQGDVVHEARVLLLEQDPRDPGAAELARRSVRAGWPAAHRALLRAGLPLDPGR